MALKLVQGGLVNLESLTMVEAADIAGILAGDEESEVDEEAGAKILAAAVAAHGGGESEASAGGALAKELLEYDGA